MSYCLTFNRESICPYNRLAHVHGAGEIAEHFDMTKPSLSHHLNTLKTAGLVDAERDGQNIIYSLNTSVLQGLMSWFYTFTDRSEDHER